MKKIIIPLILVLTMFIYPAFSQDETTSPELLKAIELLKKCPVNPAYEIINGKNPTRKPIVVMFDDLKKYNEKYEDFDSIGWKKKGKLSIIINNKHKDAPLEALAALIASRAFNVDEYDSINEEIYTWLYEGYVWKYLTNGKTVKESESDLIEREDLIIELIDKAPESARFLRKFVRSNTAYMTLPEQSPGWDDATFVEKFNQLLRRYNEIKPLN